MIPIKFMDGPLAGRTHLAEDSVGATVTIANCIADRITEVYEYKLINATHDGQRLCKFVKISPNAGEEGHVADAIVIQSDAP